MPDNCIVIDGVVYELRPMVSGSFVEKCCDCDLSFCYSRSVHNKVVPCSPRCVCTLFGQDSSHNKFDGAFCIFKKVC